MNLNKILYYFGNVHVLPRFKGITLQTKYTLINMKKGINVITENDSLVISVSKGKATPLSIIIDDVESKLKIDNTDIKGTMIIVINKDAALHLDGVNPDNINVIVQFFKGFDNFEKYLPMLFKWILKNITYIRAINIINEITTEEITCLSSRY